ncbi:hypothetical protein JTE90_006773 [Oedothorax gibbosus]|uniref:C2H2-type domain-containing protein n=1 Tax=Oedothorax gibbosus TaxID=931172 RepID=A0AAV6ULD9_9ARAC|nr:hypothetical protein JTE90_006773 [Oedothorax gibbosus]
MTHQSSISICASDDCYPMTSTGLENPPIGNLVCDGDTVVTPKEPLLIDLVDEESNGSEGRLIIDLGDDGDMCGDPLNLASHSSPTTSGLLQTPYVCFFCEKLFKKKKKLSWHLKYHTCQTLHLCPVCEKKFRRKRSYTDHMHVHSNEKHFKCAVCGETFKQKVRLQKHKKMHRPRL